MKNIVIGALAVTTIASLTGNALLYQRYSSNRPLVKVGAEAITKKQYQDAVDYQTQGAILKKMVFASLVRQAAAKANVMPTDKDIDARIALIERTKPEMLQAAQQDAGKMAELRDSLKTDLALDNLRSQGISVTDAEVTAFYDKNKQAFALPMQVQTTTVIAENAVDASTAASLLKQNTPLDIIARQPRLHVAGLNGFNPNFQALPPAVNRQMNAAVYHLKAGEVTTVPLGNQFIVFRANKSSSAGVPALAQIKDQVTEFAKLQKAPSAGQEISKLYHDSNVDFEVDRYATYFSDVQNAQVAGSSANKKTASAQ